MPLLDGVFLPVMMSALGASSSSFSVTRGLSTARYLGIEVDDAIRIGEKIDI